MPYASNDDLPPAVANHLPPHAQDIFREAFNHPPGKLGRSVIGAAYTAYIIQGIFIGLWGRALFSCEFISRAVSASALSLLVVPSTWLVAMATSQE